MNTRAGRQRECANMEEDGYIVCTKENGRKMTVEFETFPIVQELC